MNIRNMAINAILAAIYVVLTVINPIGTGAIQFRITRYFVSFHFLTGNTYRA